MKKRKLFLIALTLIMSTCFLFVFVGCNKDSQCAHEWQNTSERTDATCTEVGSQEQKCTKCGGTQTIELPALGHDFAGTWTSDENGHWHECTRDGCTVKQDEANHADTNKDHKCDTCGKMLSDHIGGTATCQKKATCTVCGNEYGELGDHDFTAETATDGYLKTAATCTGNAVYYKSCSVCGKTSKDTENEATFEKADSALNHVDDNRDHVCDRGNCGATVGVHQAAEGTHVCDYCKQKASDHTGGTATCQKKATCTVCGDEYGDLDLTNHEEGLVWKKTATTHKHTYECCGAVSVAEEAHEWENGVCTECEYVCGHTGGTATCTEQATCTVCGEKYGNSLGHNHDGSIDHKDADCTNDGVVGGTYCTRCNEGKAAAEAPITALGHNIVLDTTKGENGYTWTTDYSSCTAHGKCDRKGCTHTETATARIETNKTSDATCIYPARGDIDSFFSVSWARGERKTGAELEPALGHNYGAITIAWNDNYTAFIATRTCSNCTDGVDGHTQTAISTDHILYVTITPRPTCTEQGVGSYKVGFDADWIKGTQTVSAAIPAGEHEYRTKYDETHHWKECFWCNTVDEATKVEHTYNQTVAIDEYLATSATCQAKATYYKSCECGAHGTETFESGNALGHHIVLDTTKGENGYTWATDYSSCTAHGKCDRTDCTHTIDATATVTPTLKQAQSCVNAEIYDYTATFTEAWAETQTKENIQTNTATGHNYGAITYAWNDDYTAFIATRTCSNCTDGVDGHTQTAISTDHILYVTITPRPICTEQGVGSYKVGFDADWIKGTQTVSAAIPAGEHEYRTKYDETHHWKECFWCNTVDEATKVEHTYNQTVAIDEYLATSATCQAKATYYKSCECGAHGTETFESGDALGHHIVLDTTKGENGYTWATDYSSCTAYGKCDRTGCTHTEDAKATLSLNTIQNATCTLPERSDIDYSFSVSWAKGGRLDLVQTGPALDHNTDGNVDHKDADCTNDGVVGGTYCTRCNDGKSAAEATIPAKGHNFTQEKAEDKYLKSAATCTSSAIYYKSCADCGKSSQGEVGEATFESGSAIVHNYTAETVEDKYLKSAATCTSPAIYYKSCVDCGKSSQGEVGEATFESGNANGHHYGAVTYALDDYYTITNNEYTFIATRTCSNCAEGVEGHTQTATSVVWDFYNVITEPTCTEKGEADYYVTFNVDWIEGKQIVYGWMAKSGHKYTVTNHDDTHHWKECSVCGDVDESSKGTHTYDQNVVYKDYLATPATCIATAKYYKTCECGAMGTETFDDSHYAKHTFSADAWHDEVPATCVNTGTKGYKDCSVCNKHFDNSGNEIENLTIAVDRSAHNYVNNVCTYCDAKHPSIVFYLVGQINGKDCGDGNDYENTGDYEFDDDGKVTVDFTIASYVLVKTGDNSKWYMADSDLGQDERSKVLYSTDILGENAKKLSIPANTKATFTIVINEDNTISISFTFDCLVHNLTEHTASDATCIADGNIAYWTCSSCSNYFANAEGSALIADANKDGKITLDDTVIASAGHTGGTATCQARATCTTCGNEYGDLGDHDFDETTWVKSATSHYHACKTSGCTEKKGEAAHSGGTATCKTQAECSVCGEKYGNSLGHNIEGVDWTKDANGHHKVCINCGDKIDEATHNWENGICTVCGDYDTYGTKGLTYSYDSTTQTYTVTGYNGSEKAVHIPYFHNDGTNGEKAVTAVGENAFRGKTDITSVVISNAVTYIGDYAFNGCSALSNISIPNSVTEIGRWVFDGCSVEAYTEYGNVYYLGNEDNPYLILEKVKDTSITSCDIPTGTKFIQRNAFESCTKLESVTIPNGVLSIGVSAFSGCNKLTSVTIPNSVKTIGQKAFYNNTSLTQVTMGNGVKEIGGAAFENCNALTRVDISDVAAWCNIAFTLSRSNPLYYAKNLYLNGTLVEGLDIPKGVTEIKKYAFYNTTCLKTVELPASVTTIGDSAFDGCTGLSGVYITDIVAWLNIDINGTSNSLLSSAGSLYLDGTLLDDLVIPDNKGITEIKGYAFEGATCLKNVIIPEGVTSIGESAFRQCKNLQTVSIPNSLTTIGNDAFYGCSKIQGKQHDNAKYLGNTNNPYLVLYKAVDKNITSCTIHADTKIILSQAFSNCSNLAKITIPGKVTDIQSDAFKGCFNLQSIAIPDSVKSLGGNVFAYCTKLTSVTFGNGLTSMGDEVFKNCTALQSITLPDTITEIPMNTFYGCTKLTSVTFGKNVTEIGTYAFRDCTALTSIVIPDTVTVINGSAFYGCTELSSITLGKNLTYIYDNAFEGCVKLSEVVMPESLARINGAAFKGCTSLTTVTMCGGVTFIGNNVFNGCTSLTTINFSGTMEQWSGIVKSISWDTNTGEYTIVCTDGNISKADS